MIIHTMISRLQGVTATDFFKFMVNLKPEIYANWLPEEHHEFSIVKRSKSSPVGDLIFFDQHISRTHRLTFYAITRVAENPNHIIFQMRKFGLNLPGYLDLKFQDIDNCLLITETIRIGYKGAGKAFDPFIKLVFNKEFFNALNGHHKREWANLAEILGSYHEIKHFP